MASQSATNFKIGIVVIWSHDDTDFNVHRTGLKLFQTAGPAIRLFVRYIMVVIGATIYRCVIKAIK